MNRTLFLALVKCCSIDGLKLPELNLSCRSRNLQLFSLFFLHFLCKENGLKGIHQNLKGHSNYTLIKECFLKTCIKLHLFNLFFKGILREVWETFCQKHYVTWTCQMLVSVWFCFFTQTFSGRVSLSCSWVFCAAGCYTHFWFLNLMRQLCSALISK